jgi:ERO1-like protein beta
MHRSHATRFFVALYFLLSPSAVHGDAQCAINPNSIVSDACTSYAALDTLNRELSPSLHDLTQNTDFFAYYRLNLYNKVCPFWTDESSTCGNRACAVDTIDDERDIPPIWRAEELSKLEGMRAKHPGRHLQNQRPKSRPLQFQLGEDVDESCVFEDDDECDQRDYCVPEDEGAAAKGDYVSLVNNTERFTGYSGPGARQVWDSIYMENCFTSPTSPNTPKTSPDHFGIGGLEAASNLRSIFQEYDRTQLPSEPSDYPLSDECLEQRAFYRIISGMHTSISTHLCYDYFNQTTGEWFHNVQCYRDRLASHPDRISNLYFNYALVVRAIAKLRKHLEHYTFCSGDPEQDFSTKQKVIELTSRINMAKPTFDETSMFPDLETDPFMHDLKDDFRNRFRNVSRLMDCVGCDKCRLWGKVQTAGYGAALKVLFEFDETKNGENPHLRRTELVALVNTLGRISHSLQAIEEFRKLDGQGFSGVTEGKRKHREEPARAEAGRTSTSSVTAAPSSSPEKSGPYVPPPFKGYREPIPGPDEPDEDDDYPPQAAANQRPPRPQLSLKQEIINEVDLVWRAYKFVLKSWFELPFKLSAIAVMEMNRGWNWYMGLPVPERSWELDWKVGLPNKDEL